MFRGEYSHSIDPKGRVIIPTKFREGLGQDCVIAKEPGGCLSVYPREEWKQFESQLDSLPRSKKGDVVRFFSGSAIDPGLDKQGRIQLSSALIKFAGLEKDVVILGVLERVEIWDRVKWEEKNAIVEDNIQINMDELGF